MNVGIYTRISQDRTGDELGTTRQRKACEDLADREGWTVAEVYTDDDVSAYTGKERPGYARLIEDLQSGVIDGVVAWHPDRLHRDTRELEDFIAVVEQCGAAVRTVSAGILDLSSPSGRMTARMVGAVSKHESEQKGARVAAKMQELAEAGAYTGGGRLFGYTTGYEPVEDEVAAVREAASMILDGASLNATARMLNDTGLSTTRGNRWSGTSLRVMLTNPKLAGLKVYKGEVIGEADWAGILDRATHERLVARLTPDGRRRPTRTRLLAGLAVCGREDCGHFLVGARSTGGTATYRCPTRQGLGGCGRIGIVGQQTDDEVRDRVLAALAGPGLARALSAAVGDDTRQQELTDQLVADEAALEQLAADHYVDRILSRAEFLAARERLQERIDATRRKLAGNGRARALAAIPSSDPDELLDWWDAAPLHEQRAVLSAMIERVRIMPAAKRGARWSPDRINVDWRA